MNSGGGLLCLLCLTWLVFRVALWYGESCSCCSPARLPQAGTKTMRAHDLREIVGLF